MTGLLIRFNENPGRTGRIKRKSTGLTRFKKDRDRTGPIHFNENQDRTGLLHKTIAVIARIKN